MQVDEQLDVDTGWRCVPANRSVWCRQLTVGTSDPSTMQILLATSSDRSVSVQPSTSARKLAIGW